MRFFLIPTALAMMLPLTTMVSARAQCNDTRKTDCFIGKLVLENISGSREKKLKENFAYIDTKNVGWETSAGDITNGASIPLIFQPIIGAAFSKEFIEAAVIHDHYCDKEKKQLVRSWRETHRVFYDALINLKVDRLKAKLMYYAVYTFGPRWGYLHSSKSCALIPGATCVKDAGDGSWALQDRPANYDSEAVKAELDMVEAFLAAQRSEPKLEELERVSDTLHEDDAYLDSQSKMPAPGTGPLKSR